LTAPISPHTVGVVGSGTDEHDALARPIGELLAQLGVNLLTGGGRGVMTAVSRAFVRHPRERGISIGVIPCASLADRRTSRAGYPNAFVELAIRTHLPLSGDEGTGDLSRNHINVLSCDALVALPGGPGTASEVSLAVRYGKPIVVFAPAPALVRHFPPSVDRFESLDRVRQFLRSHVGR